MRIGLLTGEYPPMQGGISAHCAVLARHLSAEGHHVAVFSAAEAHSDEPAIRLTRLRDRWGPFSMSAVRQWALSERLDVVNLHFQTAAFQMSPWIHFLPARLRGIPLVTTFHDLRFPYLFPKAGPLRNGIVMHLARTSDGVIATNHEDAQRLAHLKHRALIPIGSSVNTALPPHFDRASWRAELGLPREAFVIAHFGFINRSKGLDDLVRALAKLNEGHLLLIGGRTGASDPSNVTHADEIDALIAQQGLEHRVHRTGYLEATGVSAAFAAADGVALPFKDGASYRRSSLMAAIAHGCAIVTTQPVVDIPAFTEGEPLALVERENPAQLARRLDHLRTQPAERERLRAGALAIRRHFDWDTITAQNVRFFERVIAGEA